MYKVGIIGPNMSVERIINLAKELETGIEFIAYPAEDVKQMKKTILEHSQQVNAWLLSGPVPYAIAKQVLDSDEKLYYIMVTESSIYKVFLQMSYSLGKIIERASIDMIDVLQENLVTKAFKQLDKAPADIYIKSFTADFNTEELIRFHIDLWKKGKTEGAFTCLPAVYDVLTKEGIPVYRLSPTDIEVEQTLKMLAGRVKTFYFQSTQVGIEIIEIEQFDQIIEKTNNIYHPQYLELDLNKVILKLCERLNGSFLYKGNGRYVIFSSRGAIEREIAQLQKTVEQLSLETDTAVSVGIGFGETAFSAELNARRAVQQSKMKGNGEIFIVQENGLMVESVGKEEELVYSYRSEDKDVIENLNKANISIKTFKKIEALINRMGWDSFAASDLATHLAMTLRNAQRIIASLCEFNLAEAVGEEVRSSRGRPSKIYRLK